MTTIDIDQKIIQYLNENSDRLSPCSPVDIANAFSLSAEDVWKRCEFLLRKDRIKASGMGTKIENKIFYI